MRPNNASPPPLLLATSVCAIFASSGLIGEAEPIKRDPDPPFGECECTDLKTVVLDRDFRGDDLKSDLTTGLTVQDCCKLCATDPQCKWFQVSTDPSQPDLCWLKSAKGGEENTQPRYGAAVSARFVTDPTFCSLRARAGWGWSFLAVCALAGGAYAGLGVARTGKAALPHPEFWQEAHALVLDGVAFARGGGEKGVTYSAVPDAVRASERQPPPKKKGGGEGSSKERRAKSGTENAARERKTERPAKAPKKSKAETAAAAAAAAAAASTASGGGGRWVLLPS